MTIASSAKNSSYCLEIFFHECGKNDASLATFVATFFLDTADL